LNWFRNVIEGIFYFSPGVDLIIIKNNPRIIKAEAMIKIMVISSDQSLIQDIQNTLAGTDYQLSLLALEEDFLWKISQEKPRVLIIHREENLDQTFKILNQVKEYDPLLEVIIVGSAEKEVVVAQALRLGALDYLSWPLRSSDLQQSLKKLEEKISIRRQTYQLEKELAGKYVFEGMVSRNPVMLEIFSLLERLSKHQITVLITGETGTGKELAARAIHNLSPRRERPWVVVDCPTLPETLFESEVFGYERGAFTGADRSKPGLLKAAEGGTIFFDEISEVPLSAQAKLLRFIAEGTFRPLGSNRSERVEARVICATNRDLRAEVRAGHFREDLFHRINVATIELPPLRKRKEDIPLLILHFIEKYNLKYQKNVRGLSNRTKKLLIDYDWPGNIRELEKVIERGVALTTESFIDLQHLPENLLNWKETEENKLPYPYTDLTLFEIEKKHIQEVLKAVGFNKQKAALKLGISRPALYRKLRRYGLES